MEYNPTMKQKTLIEFDYMIDDMLRTNKLIQIVAELFVRGRKLNFLICFYYTILFRCSKEY